MTVLPTQGHDAGVYDVADLLSRLTVLQVDLPSIAAATAAAAAVVAVAAVVAPAGGRPVQP